MLFRLSAAAAVAALCAVVLSPALQAHEGHDEAPPAAATAAIPRAEASSDAFELVAVVRAGGLDLYLDAFATNAPVEGARIALDTPAGLQQAVASAGQPYRLAADFLAVPGRYDLVATVTAGGQTDVLPLSIEVPAPDAHAETPAAAGSAAAWSAWLSRQTLVGLGLGALIGLLAGRWRGRRRAVPTAALVLLAAIVAAADRAAAHDGEDHDAPAPAASGLARRLPDGAIEVPKPLQRIFAIRTVVTASGTHRRTVELPGRVIPDPNASGFVQAAAGGRLSPPEGGFPRLGTRVKAGDVLAWVAPPLAAIDRSDMRQRQGELDQQIAIVEARVARYEVLAPTGAATRTQLDEARIELQGLRDRRASLDRARREPEALVAPVSGVIADGNPVAGQVVQANAVIYQIIDPARLWIEALSYDSVSDQTEASASTAGGGSLPLAFRGAGLADRSQSVPVHFAITGEGPGLRAGQFVTVRLSRAEARTGIALPRAALVRSSGGQDVVFEHTAAERFVPRPVRAEPVDGDRVLILAGLEPGVRIAVQGAELLDQVR
jgi:hypothetical protein